MNTDDVSTTKKTNPSLSLTSCRAKLENPDTFPPPRISQSSSRHGDTAWGLMQIFSEVTFSADTPLSLRTRIGTHACTGGQWFTDSRRNMFCHLLSLVQNVNCWPAGSTSLGWVGGSAAIRRSNPRLIDLIRAHKLQTTTRLFILADRLNHVGELVSGRGLRSCAKQPEHLRGKTHTYTHFEGHWTWGEWLRVNNIWSPVTQIPIRMSTMKHLPIKSNDACDLKGIMVKWCIQRDYGHLQMAGVQESAKSFDSLYWHKAGGWARDVFSHQHELNALSYKHLNPFIIACIGKHLCLASREIVGECTSINVFCEKWS